MSTLAASGAVTGAAFVPASAPAAFAPADDPFGVLMLADVDLAALSPEALLSADVLQRWFPVGDIATGTNAAAVVAPPGLYSGGNDRRDVGADDSEACLDCGGPLRRGVGDLHRVCGDCGIVVEGDPTEPDGDEAPRAAPSSACLRIVGPNSGYLQSDLYRSGGGNTAETQRKQIYEEYKLYNERFIEAGGRSFPLNACSQAAEYYGGVQRTCVKRSQNKKAIMATCLYYACLDIGFAPTKAEVAKFMQMETLGIARGDNFVRALAADGKMDIEVNADPCRPEILTLFTQLGYDSDRYKGLREAAYQVVQTAVKNNIGTSSVSRSKVAGATFTVLSRCLDRALVPRPPKLQEFCEGRIRKNTVERFTKQLGEYHSYFEPVYRAAGLRASP